MPRIKPSTWVQPSQQTHHLTQSVRHPRQQHRRQRRRRARDRRRPSLGRDRLIHRHAVHVPPRRPRLLTHPPHHRRSTSPRTQRGRRLLTDTPNSTRRVDHSGALRISHSPSAGFPHARRVPIRMPPCSDGGILGITKSADINLSRAFHRCISLAGWSMRRVSNGLRDAHHENSAPKLSTP